MIVAFFAFVTYWGSYWRDGSGFDFHFRELLCLIYFNFPALVDVARRWALGFFCFTCVYMRALWHSSTAYDCKHDSSKFNFHLKKWISFSKKTIRGNECRHSTYNIPYIEIGRKVRSVLALHFLWPCNIRFTSVPQNRNI